MSPKILLRQRAERRRHPRRSHALVHEMMGHREALQEKVTVASMTLNHQATEDGVTSEQARQLRNVIHAAELDLHALSAKTLEWATAIQEEMVALRRV